MKAPAEGSETQSGFTRTDLCVLIVLGAFLGLLCTSALGKMKPHSDRASCVNNLRQINLALAMYSADNARQFPVRNTPNAWPTTLFPYYKDLRLLVCPSDRPFKNSTFPTFPAENAPRSYIINGWNDYFVVRFSNPPAGTLYRIMQTNAISLDDILFPTATIAFGEKTSESFHMTVDLDAQWDDIVQMEQARHDRSQQTPQTGGSNYAMVDGQVQYLKYGAALTPVNLWAVTQQYRTNTIVMP
jgi:prepilin-type processing-associated H-X9-DG protein